MKRALRLLACAAGIAALAPSALAVTARPAAGQETPAMEEALEERPGTFPPSATTPEAIGPGAVVEMRHDHRFVPTEVVIEAGEEVVWRNASTLEHTVTLDPAQAEVDDVPRMPEGAESFDSGVVEPGREYRRRFAVPGRYRYFCSPHQGLGMIGEIRVLQAGEPGPAASE